MGQIRAALEKAELLERTVVIISADHGEALFEHGWIGHNVQLYDESMHIPLIVRLPAGKGPAAGTRLRTLTDLLDVAPTIADLFGVMGRGGSERQFQGRSLLPALIGRGRGRRRSSRGRSGIVRATPAATRATSSSTTRARARRSSTTSSRDPGEKKNLVAADPLRAAWSRQSLHHWIASAARAATSGAVTPAHLTREQCENLKALGYLGADIKCTDN